MGIKTSKRKKIACLTFCALCAFYAFYFFFTRKFHTHKKQKIHTPEQKQKNKIFMRIKTSKRKKIACLTFCALCAFYTFCAFCAFCAHEIFLQKKNKEV